MREVCAGNSSASIPRSHIAQNKKAGIFQSRLSLKAINLFLGSSRSGGGFGLGFFIAAFFLDRDADRRFPALRTFLGFADDDVIAFRAGDRAFDEQKIFRLAHLDDLKILRRARVLTHVTGHPHSAHDRAGEKSLTDRAAAAMPAFRAVRRIATGETMAFHNAFKAAAFGDADRVNEIAGRKQASGRRCRRVSRPWKNRGIRGCVSPPRRFVF